MITTSKHRQGTQLTLVTQPLTYHADKALTSETEGDTGGGRTDPVAAAWHNGRGARPAEDEHRDGHEPAPEHHANETILGISLATLGYHLCSVQLLESGSDYEGAGGTDPHRDEGKSNVTVVPAIVLAEDDRVAEEEGVL